ncbi:MAG TPA: sugar transferase, partial [Acidimicrobiales bacterium]|nr:sugar transferase [Acidimicrobiales bacterium]
MSLTYAAVTLLVMWIGGAYRPRIFYRLWNQLPTLLGQLTVSTLLFSVWPDRHRVDLLEHLPLLIGLVILARLITYGVVRKLRSRPGRSEQALVIGADRSGRLVADALLRSASGIRPIGFIDRPGASAPAGLPVFGDLAHLDAVVDRMGVRHVIVADAGDRSAALSASLYDCKARHLEVWVIPPMFELGAEFFGSATHDIWAIPFRHLRTPGQHTAARLVKRAFDFSVAATMLVLTSPVLVVTALAVRLTSAGPVFFRQTR